jgi:hypothetical protein
MRRSHPVGAGHRGGESRLRGAAAILVTLACAAGAVGCGGGGGAKHGQVTATSTASTGTVSVPIPSVNATFPRVTPGTPGLENVAVQLPAPSMSLTPGSAATGGGLSQKVTGAGSGAVIHLASGSYPEIVDHVERSGWVTVSGEGDATKPVIHGAELFGARYVRFVDVSFSDTFKVDRSPKGAGHSGDIQLLNSDVNCGSHTTKPNTVAIAVRGASYDVAFSGDYVHNCTVGFKSQAQDEMSRNISITHSIFESLFGDAIDLGGMDGITIANDVIRDIHRTHGFIYHDDGIQFFGNCANVLIAYNVEALSTDQLIFIQDAVKSKYTHSSVNQNILVLGNLLYSAGAYAVQDQGGVDVQFVGNTIWHNKDGGLLIRRSGFTHIEPTHTLVADNVVAGFGVLHTPHIVQGYNVFGDTHAGILTRTDISSGSPGFVDEAKGLFGLRSGSPAAHPPAPQATLIEMAREAGAPAAAIAVLKTYTADYRGALAVNSSQPSFATPRKRLHRHAHKHDVVTERTGHHHHHHRAADTATTTVTVTRTATSG